MGTRAIHESFCQKYRSRTTAQTLRVGSGRSRLSRKFRVGFKEAFSFFESEYIGRFFRQNYFEDDLTIEGVIMDSKEYKKKYKIDEEEKRYKTKNKLIQKSVFPRPHNPNLLTWIEKETIKYLHKLDPVEWSVDRLADR